MTTAYAHALVIVGALGNLMVFTACLGPWSRTRTAYIVANVGGALCIAFAVALLAMVSPQ